MQSDVIRFASLLLLWAVGVVSQESDVVGLPAASELTLAQLSERVSLSDLLNGIWSAPESQFGPIWQKHSLLPSGSRT